MPEHGSKQLCLVRVHLKKTPLTKRSFQSLQSFVNENQCVPNLKMWTLLIDRTNNNDNNK